MDIQKVAFKNTFMCVSLFADPATEWSFALREEKVCLVKVRMLI